MARRYRNVPRAQDRPIVPAPTGSNYHFTIVYNKGAWVLHMLRWVLGDSTFFQALGEHSQQGRDSSVTVAGFAAVAEQVSGTELDWFFDEWLYHIGYPKYHLDWSATPAGDSVRVVLGVSQVNGSGAPYLFRTPLPVKLNIPGPDTTLVVRPAANPQVDTFTVAGYPTGLAIDPDDWVLDSSYVTHAGVVEPSGPGVRPSVFEATVVRGTLPLPRGASTSSSLSLLLDAAGRKVLDLKPGANDVSRLVPGVYFVSYAARQGPETCWRGIKLVISN